MPKGGPHFGGTYWKRSGETARARNRREKIDKAHQRHHVLPKVWVIAQDMGARGLLPISPKTFANKLQRVIDAAGEERHLVFQETNDAEVRKLMVSAFEKMGYPWAKDLIKS